MPAMFIGHGSPMNTLETNRFTAAWRAFGQGMPKPRAVLCVSAHWYGNISAVTAMARPRTIHDFYGFPPALSEFQYPAPGDARLAEEVADVARPDHVVLDNDSWGLDHGTWSVLAHLLPKADVPVVQLSIHARRDVDWHVQLGARLAPLRGKGVLILGSGNVVHNLRAMQWQEPELAFDWAERFDEAARKVMTGDPAGLGKLAQHRDFAMAAPTDEHFLPLAYLAGIAGAAGKPAEQILKGCAYGSISMACYAIDARVAGAKPGKPAAAIPHDVPAEDTNA
jgi:4,5-DOPA dioxygenase extradiol